MLASWPKQKGSTARRLQRVTAPTVEPISFELQKSALKIGNINSNAFVIQSKIAAARSLVERKLNRCLVQQTWDLFLDGEAVVGAYSGFFANYGQSLAIDQDLRFPEIRLPLPPVQKVLGVYVTDEFGSEQIVDPSIYSVTKSKEPCRIRLNRGQCWPSSQQGFETFRIRFTAGYAVPFQVAQDGSNQILASNHGYNAGDYVIFTSLDGTLPGAANGSSDNGIQWGQSYQVTNVATTGFQLLDDSGNLVSINDQWAGTGFIGEIPAPIIEAMVMISSLNQGGEVPSRIPGASGSSRLSPIEVPLEPEELLRPYIWPFL